jgi:integrase
MGKTLRDGSASLRRHKDLAACPVRAIDVYVGFAKGVGTDLTKGYLFRPTTNDGAVIDRPFSSSAANSRLKQYLRGAGIEESATPHGFRGAL